jgi:2-oxoisovalerate dehydrogenase E1 component
MQLRSLMLDDDRIVEQENYDLGLAVALEGDRLATAVITEANKLAWLDFVRRYNETSKQRAPEDRGDERAGRSAASARSGADGRAHCCPAVGRDSFVGTAHPELSPNGKKAQSVEVVTLSLTFDHRVERRGAASFAREIKELIEGFESRNCARSPSCLVQSWTEQSRRDA